MRNLASLFLGEDSFGLRDLEGEEKSFINELYKNVASIFIAPLMELILKLISDLFQNFNPSTRFSTKWKRWITGPNWRQTKCQYVNVGTSYIQYIKFSAKRTDIFELETPAYMGIDSSGQTMCSYPFHTSKPHCVIQALCNSNHLQ